MGIVPSEDGRRLRAPLRSSDRSADGMDAAVRTDPTEGERAGFAVEGEGACACIPLLPPERVVDGVGAMELSVSLLLGMRG